MSQHHLDTPGPDTGYFSTTEVRPATKPSTASTSRIVQFPKEHYHRAPRIAAGFSTLHLSHERPLRAEVEIDDVSKEGMRVGVRSWGAGDEDGKGKGKGKGKVKGKVKGGLIYEAGVTWVEARRSARECRLGAWDTRDVIAAWKKGDGKKGETGVREGQGGGAGLEGEELGETEGWIAFDPPFDSKALGSVDGEDGEVDVICWLSRLDMDSGAGGRNFRINCYATDVTGQGFTAHIDTWGDTVLRGAGMNWIAFPRAKKGVACGTFGTADVRSWSEARSRNEGRVVFPNGKFARETTPKVLVGLNMFDYAGNADLRIRTCVEGVDGEGAKWRLDAWGDSTMYAAGASWVALGL